MGRKQTKRAIGLLLCAACLLSVTGCGGKQGDGTQGNPFSVGETAVYDGEGREYWDFQMKITLEDAVRGEEALAIYELASFSEVTVPEGSELLAAKMTVEITGGEGLVPLGGEDVDMFRLVSSDGVNYEKLLFRQELDQNIFVDAYQGNAQTGHLFYWVDKDDANPLIAFCPNYKGGIWFKTTLSEKERGKDRITIEEWEASDSPFKRRSLKTEAPEGNFGGTFADPLPIGEWGYSIDTLMYPAALEVQTTEVRRGDAANEIAEAWLIGWSEDNVPDGQEMLAVHVVVNALEVAGTEDPENPVFSCSDNDFKLVASKKGIEYERIFGNIYGFNDMYAPGSQSRWLLFAVDKDDDAPILGYESGSDVSLWFSLKQDAVLAEGLDHYASRYDSALTRDNAAPKGNARNPYAPGEAAQIMGDAVDIYDLNEAFTGKITVLRTLRGNDAAAALDQERIRETQAGLELIVLKLQVEVEELTDNQSLDFSAASFSLMDEGLATFIGRPVSSYELQEPLEEAYPGAPVTGYIGFYVPRDVEQLYLSYGKYNTQSAVWMEIDMESRPEIDIESILDAMAGERV